MAYENEGKEVHCQCELVNASAVQIAWIPGKYAKVGKILKLGKSDGWEVVRVYSRLDSAYVQDASQDYRYQREASDI